MTCSPRCGSPLRYCCTLTDSAALDTAPPMPAPCAAPATQSRTPRRHAGAGTLQTTPPAPRPAGAEQRDDLDNLRTAIKLSQVRPVVPRGSPVEYRPVQCLIAY